MKKLISIDTKHFFTGITPGAYVDTGGIWSEAQGINVFRDLVNTTQAGLLQASPDMTTLSASVDGTPMAQTSTNTNDGTGDATKMYYITDEGFIGRLDATGVTPGAPTEVRAEESQSALVWPGTGLETLQTANSGLSVFYFHNLSGSSATNLSAAIGVYGDINSSNPAFTDAFATEYKAAVNGLQQNVTLNRPTHKFRQKIYHGHDYRVGSISEDSSGNPVNTFEDLDLPKNQEVTALEDDGNFLVIGSSNNVAGDARAFSDTNVWFWDTSSVDINRVWTIKDAYITGLRRVGNLIYALCPNGLWAFNYQTRPFKVYPLGRNGKDSVESQTNPDSKVWIANDAIGSINNAVVWGGNQTINTFGELLNGLRDTNTRHQPYADLSASTGAMTMVATDANFDNVIVGTSGTSETGYFPINNSGGTGLTAKTIYFPLGKQTVIQRIEVILGEPLASGDILNIDVQADEDESENTDGSTWGIISFAVHGAKKKIQINRVKTVENLKVLLTFAGGNVKIKAVNIYGHAVADAHIK